MDEQDEISTLREALAAWQEPSASGNGPVPYFQGGIDPGDPDKAYLFWGPGDETRITIERADDLEVSYVTESTFGSGRSVSRTFDSIEALRHGMWEVIGEPDPLQPPGETPSIADLAEQLREEYGENAPWRIYENDIYAHVFEFAEHRRLQIWDEADFMGSIDGYSWQEQVWSGAEWVDVTVISTENGIPPLSVHEIRTRLEEFRTEADATRPEMLTTREAALDRLARSALGASARMAHKVAQLDQQLGMTTEDLRTSERESEKVRAALIALAQRITPPPERRRSAPESTGPSTGNPTPTAAGPDL